MNIKDLVSVNGLPGLYRLITTKGSGIVVESLDTGQKRFLTTRKFQFSPLESIAVFTETDTLPLEDVFKKMIQHPPQKDLPKSDLRDYFSKVIPEHHHEKVYDSDIRKIVSWFLYLDEKGYMVAEEEKEDTSEEE